MFHTVLYAIKNKKVESKQKQFAIHSGFEILTYTVQYILYMAHCLLFLKTSL